MSRYNYRLTSVRVEDANGLGMTLTPTTGDFSGPAENDNNREKARVLDRGSFDGLVEVDDMQGDISMTLGMRNEALTHASAARVTDFFKKQGSFAAAVSVDPCVWAFKVIVTLDDGTTSTTKTYPYCTGTVSPAQGNPENTFSLAITSFKQPIDA